MSVGVIALQSIAQPNDLTNPKPMTKLLLNLGAVEAGVTVGVQKARLGSQERALPVCINGSTFQNKIMCFKWSFRHGARPQGNAVIRVPRGVFLTPTIKSEVVSYPGWMAFLTVQHENRTAVTQPGIVGGYLHDFKIGRIQFGASNTLADERGRFTVVG